MLKTCVNFLTSLRLTVVLLGLALILVFVGTLAEVRMGLYDAQAEIFRSLFVHWTPAGSHLRIPVFPGGWFIGLALLVNLLAAHIQRFQFRKRKAGIFLIHAGLICLLAGQFLTEMFQVESQMRLPVGATMNYSEDSRNHELAVIDVTDPDHDSVVSIAEPLLAPGGEIHPAGLPFALRVKSYFQNSQPGRPDVRDRRKTQSQPGNRPATSLHRPPGGQTDGRREPAHRADRGGGRQPFAGRLDGVVLAGQTAAGGGIAGGVWRAAAGFADRAAKIRGGGAYV